MSARIKWAMLAVAGVLLAGAALADDVSVVEPEGRWLAEDITGAGVIDNVQTILEIGADGRATGSGGCNRYTGAVMLNGAAISFGPAASTRMACPPAVMDQEQKFFTALGEVRGWRVDATTGKLALLDATGSPVLIFSPLD
jgi:putative lipoprotein